MWSVTEDGSIIECSLNHLIPSKQMLEEEPKVARVALADFIARIICRNKNNKNNTSKNNSNKNVNYILERNDVYCDADRVYVTTLSFYARGEKREDLLRELNKFVLSNHRTSSSTDTHTSTGTDTRTSTATVPDSCQQKDNNLRLLLLRHLACSIGQHRIRKAVQQKGWVAFLTNGAVLPRKSGANQAPMSTPPAVPFLSPQSFQTTLNIQMGSWRDFLNHTSKTSTLTTKGPSPTTKTTNWQVTGMAIQAGITLICGGGYHGKSTLLRTIAAGVYNKIPGDGRELCVTVHDAVTVRAEDGRYVNNCNVSAFISDLPVPPGVKDTIDTTKFSTREASGSTSQAANVSEAIEMGATAMLIDEDVSAANFMARDGRMRALVMDESITPLLYRVNGLFNTHNISSIVVVGGVGDWLDVPHRVILLHKYVAADATAKANSISRQFSYGHVQYGGRGVVHRLPWDATGTPAPRRPTKNSIASFGTDMAVSLVEGSSSMLSITENHRNTRSDDSLNYGDDGDDNDHGAIDLSRCEQLLGKRSQLIGCGYCVLWMLKQFRLDPSKGVTQMIEQLQVALDRDGFRSILLLDGSSPSPLIQRPRRHEIFMALTRLRGIVFEEMPAEENEAELAARLEEERRKAELARMWEKRRKNNRFS